MGVVPSDLSLSNHETNHVQCAFMGLSLYFHDKVE